MHKSLLPRYSSCIRFSPPVRLAQAFRSSTAVKRRPLNPRPSSVAEVPPPISEVPAKRGLPKRDGIHSPTKGVRLAAPGIPPGYIHDLPIFLAENVRRWTRLETVRIRLITFGVAGEDVQPALNAFASYVIGNDILEQLDYTEEQISIMREDLSDPDSGVSVDVQLTRLFYEWAANPIGHSILAPLVSHSTLTRIARLFEATDMSQPAAQYDMARAAPRRKIIMHVGPTNSGKTHNALRALAAAPTGVYCGPLRMLAFEIWERLNKGRIVPLGHDAEAVGEEDPDTVTDAIAPGEKPAVQKIDNPKFARVCNLITGDDQRIVAEDAPLVSCTVEMLSSHYYDVAVIDEIQLISDPDRGGSWTHALLGVNAREVHLCGEESAVPLVKRIIEDVGDEFEVNRYQRLTPLTVAKHSLNNKLSRVEKGDCVVAFSRSEIYKLRDKIEKFTGHRCALAYGKLPPEVRSQQAALFNDPDSGYDVLVGSDAVGMGLNLKIKRLVFARTTKWDGFEEKPLSVRHLKQIAGRAGRFGLHGNDSSGGVVTALHESAMHAIRAALAAPIEELKKARYRPPGAQLYIAAMSLPPETPLSSIPWLFHYVGKHHPIFALESPQQAEDATQHIDNVCGDMPIQMRLTLKSMPLRWKDPRLVGAAYTLLRMLRDDLSVRIHLLAVKTGITKTLKDVAAAYKRENDMEKLQSLIQDLEVSHGTLVAYIWMSYRLPVCFPDQEDAAQLRDKVQAGLEYFLSKLSSSKFRRSSHDDYRPRPPFFPRKMQRPKTLRLKRQEHTRED